MSPPRRIGAALIAFLIPCASGAGQARAAAVIAPETVEARVSGGRAFAWTSRFEAAVDDGVVRVRVGVHLAPAGGVTRVELERAIPGWRAGIERLWGGKFALATAEGERYPIMVTVDFRGPVFHHDVVVRPGAGRADQLDWHVGDPPEVVAHEVGHMLGAPDDYRGGATGPEGVVDDPASVMTADPRPQVLPRARHFEGIRTWFAGRISAQVEIVALHPEPGAGQYAQDAQRDHTDRRDVP